MTEFELFQALRPLYPDREYALLPQVANGTGSHARRHCDALALSLWPSRGLHVTGFEIKSYKGDWLREKANPEKAEEIAGFCHHWYIVAAGPFVSADDMPNGWGLLVWDAEKNKLVTKKKAPLNTAKPMTPVFIAAILRQAQEVATPVSVIANARAEGFKAGKETADYKSQLDSKDLVDLRKKLAVIKKKTGIDLTSWKPAEEIADALDAVLNGTANRTISSLRRVAREIVKEFGSEDLDAASL